LACFWLILTPVDFTMVALLVYRVSRRPRPSKKSRAIRPASAVLIILLVLILGRPAFGDEPALPSQGGEAPAEQKIHVLGFEITGNTAISTSDLQALLASYVGESLTLPELQEAVDGLTEEYRRRGYTLAKAYLPAQEIRAGIVGIAVLEGRIGELRVTGNQRYSDRFIRDHFSEVSNEGVIRHTSLEHSLVLLNDYPNLNVSASLEPGQSVGTTDIVAHVTDERPVHVTLDYNNFGVPFISRNRFGAGLEVGNVLIEGSLLKLNGIIGENPDRLLFQLLSYSVPVNRYGTRFVLSGSNGRFDVGGQLAALEINGKIKTYDLSVTHPFIKSRFENLLIDAGFASKDNRLFMLGQVTGDDHLRMLKAGVNYDRSDIYGRNFLSVYGFQGLGEAFGGMDNDDPLATRRGADNRFTKANVAAGRVHKVTDEAFLILRAAGQITTGPLPIIEQFLLGGPDSVRGYQLGERLGDEGYNVSAEGRLPIGQYVQLTAFIDHGASRVRNPAAGESKAHFLTGAGPGIRVNLPYFETMLRADLGFPIDPPKALSGSLTGGSSPTLYLQVTARF
jgi:hemolysin activation/secretion protein